MNNFVELWSGGPTFAQSEHFKLGTDSILLADFVNLSSRRRGIDLGCGSGILPLLLLNRAENFHMTGLEINESACDYAKSNLSRNGFESRSDIICGDIRNHRQLFKSGEFDLVVSNPPYFAEGSGFSSPDCGRANAREEKCCSLDDICRAAAFLCKTGGTFSLVHRAERLSEVFCKLSDFGLEPKRLRTVSHCASSEPSLVLIEARRGGKPGLKIMPPLFLRNSDGSETDEILKIYHREEKA